MIVIGRERWRGPSSASGRDRRTGETPRPGTARRRCLRQLFRGLPPVNPNIATWDRNKARAKAGCAFCAGRRCGGHLTFALRGKMERLLPFPGNRPPKADSDFPTDRPLPSTRENFRRRNLFKTPEFPSLFRYFFPGNRWKFSPGKP